MQNLLSDGSSPGMHRERGEMGQVVPGAGDAQRSPDYQLAGVVPCQDVVPPRGLCTSHNKESFICSCSTVSASWSAGVYVPAQGAAQGQGWRVVDPAPPSPQLKKLWCFESHSPRSLKPDISDPGEKKSGRRGFKSQRVTRSPHVSLTVPTPGRCSPKLTYTIRAPK